MEIKVPAELVSAEGLLPPSQVASMTGGREAPRVFLGDTNTTYLHDPVSSTGKAAPSPAIPQGLGFRKMDFERAQAFIPQLQGK